MKFALFCIPFVQPFLTGFETLKNWFHLPCKIVKSLSGLLLNSIVKKASFDHIQSIVLVEDEACSDEKYPLIIPGYMDYETSKGALVPPSKKEV